MKPDTDTTPGLGLPQPPAGPGQAPMPYAPSVFQPPATAAMPQFSTVAQPPLPPVVGNAGMVASQPSPQPLVGQMQPPMAAHSFAQDVSMQHSDGDDNALDVEWVGKAREVVERTHTDPYLQSKELSHVKAQYIKARYNKDIKLSEDQQ